MLLTANIFQPLINVFQAVLTFFHDHVGVSWGLAIVLMTILIRALLIPLTVKQYHSMRRLQAHMPELKEIQARYKDDKQRQQQEVMKFYQENKVNPFGSCLPLAAQLPVFISLFYMLRQSLRHDICPDLNPAAHAAKTYPCGTHGHAGFLFISDLTNKATGITLIVLLVLYIGTQLGSSLMAAQPTMDRNQRLMMLGLPLIFVFVVIGFPAGLLVYWITTNTWTIAQQYVIKKRLGPPPVAAATAGGATATGTSVGRAGPTAAKASGSASGGSKPAGGGGLGARLLGRSSTNGESPAGEAEKRSRGTQAPPPPSPRKKKKRSGRRR
jgi:YidC/Oxa1 family membrane protein insertase